MEGDPTKLSIRRAKRSDLLAVLTLLADDILGAGREMVSDPPSAVYLKAP